MLTSTETSEAIATPRSRDPQATKEDILQAAIAEFSRFGLAGARVDRIASTTRTTKRMLYYYFRSKEQLYLRSLERSYEVVRELESRLDLGGLEPTVALRKLAEATYEHHTSHQDFIRLVAMENINRAETLSRSDRIADLNATAVDSIRDVLGRGIREGTFRDDLDALDVHMIVSSFAVFHVANRYTFRFIFGRDLLADQDHLRYRALAGDLVVATLTCTSGVRA